MRFIRGATIAILLFRQMTKNTTEFQHFVCFYCVLFYNNHPYTIAPLVYLHSSHRRIPIKISGTDVCRIGRSENIDVIIFRDYLFAYMRKIGVHPVYQKLVF